MPLKVIEKNEDGPHGWAVIHCTCDLDADDDALMALTVETIREAYGEKLILEAAQLPQADPSVALTFDLEAITKAFRSGLPDPDGEGKKPPHLTNYRSESAEMLARIGLQEAFQVLFPASPQQGKVNASQPILGFDGWGILPNDASNFSFVLIQVKGVEDPKCPPGQVENLVNECKAVPTNPDKISRALSVLITKLSGSPLLPYVVRMLEDIGKGNLPPLIVAPSVVRGVKDSDMGDLTPLQTAKDEFLPALCRGLSISIGVDLTKFGYKVMTTARAA